MKDKEKMSKIQSILNRFENYVLGTMEIQDHEAETCESYFSELKAVIDREVKISDISVGDQFKCWDEGSSWGDLHTVIWTPEGYCFRNEVSEAEFPLEKIVFEDGKWEKI